MASLALNPVAAAVYTALNVEAVTNKAIGGVHDDLPQTVTLPCVLFSVHERPAGGFGTVALPEIDLRVHVYSQYAGWKEAHAVMQQVILKLKDRALTVSGYTQAGLVFYDGTQSVGESMIRGVKCKELMAMFRVYVEEA